jgi:hypothetical protein
MQQQNTLPAQGRNKFAHIIAVKLLVLRLQLVYLQQNEKRREHIFQPTEPVAVGAKAQWPPFRVWKG